MSRSKIETGKRGELIAQEYLIDKGYEILENNYRYGHGEIDIIARSGGLLIFVEVKTRRNKSFGETIFSVTPSKLKQIKKIAELYLYENDVSECGCRFDAITVDFSSNEDFIVEHYKNIS